MISEEQAISMTKHLLDNRAFLFGESIFSTFLCQGQKIIFEEEHLTRLEKCADYVWGEGGQVRSLFCHRREEILDHTGIWRATFYSPDTSWELVSGELRLHLSFRPLEKKMHDVVLQTMKTPGRPEWWPDFLKSGDYFERLMSYRQKNQDATDLLFCSNSEEIWDTTRASLFGLKNNQLMTSPTGPNVLDSIGRKKVLLLAKKHRIEVSVAPISLRQLFSWEAAFLVNAARGIRKITKIDDTVFKTHPMIEKFSADFLEE